MFRMRAFLPITLLGGLYTVCVPTAPVPTQGFVYLPADCLWLLPGARVADAMRVVFACGAGAAEVLGGELAATAGAEDAR